MSDSTDSLASPCVSICVLDEQDICIGCHRTGMEISQWGRLSVDSQREVLQRCRHRMLGDARPCVIRHG